MRNPISGGQFKRDARLAVKRGKDMEKLRSLVLLLVKDGPIPANYKDHPLRGEWQSFRNCHIEPDWMLIYKIDENDLHLVRTGTHADIFGK